LIAQRGVVRPDLISFSQPFCERPKGLAAMRDGELRALAHVSERAAVGRVIEDRVVSESAIALRPIADRAFDGTDGLKHDAPVLNDSNGAQEARSATAFGMVREAPKNRREPLRVGGVGSEKACRAHA